MYMYIDNIYTYGLTRTIPGFCCFSSSEILFLACCVKGHIKSSTVTGATVQRDDARCWLYVSRRKMADAVGAGP